MNSTFTGPWQRDRVRRAAASHCMFSINFIEFSKQYLNTITATRQCTGSRRVPKQLRPFRVMVATTFYYKIDR